MKQAVLLAAVCNFFGLLLSTAFSAAVAMTITDLADFGADRHQALVALTAGLLVVVVWTVAAWVFSLPTSESHALAAALTGAAVALRGGFSAVHLSAWVRVLWGLAASLGLGLALGYFMYLFINRAFYRKNKNFFCRLQIIGGAAMAAMHGAQDGQKFLGALLLALGLGTGQAVDGGHIPPWLLLLCALVCAAGTAVGGGRIIRAVGQELVTLTPKKGFSADLGGALALLFCTLLGLPASTTHAKTCAILGVGFAGRSGGGTNLRLAAQMVAAWLLTFPVCFALGYALTRGAFGNI
jgi:PiT family inorganic phosphate transporter